MQMRHQRLDDRGLTLAETLVYCVLLAIVLTFIGSMLITSLRVRQDSEAINRASNDGQIVVAGLERAMRNAVDVAVTPEAGGVTFRARVRIGDVGDPKLQCEGWHIAADGSIRTTSGSASALPAATTTAVATWRPVVHGASSSVGPDLTSAIVMTGQTLSINLSIDPGRDKPPVLLGSTVSSRKQSSTVIGGNSCF